MSTKYGQMLAEARRAEGRSQTWLADMVGVSRVHLSLVETGARKPFPVSTTMAAVEALDIPALPLLLETIPVRGVDSEALKNLSRAGFALLASLVYWLPVLGPAGANIIHEALERARTERTDG